MFLKHKFFEIEREEIIFFFYSQKIGILKHFFENIFLNKLITHVLNVFV